MQLKVFAVPALGDDAATDALNRFLGAHRIVTVDRHFVPNGPSSFWAICVLYLAASDGRPATPRRGKLDYREVLPELEFALYAKLRALRKQLADQEGTPAYALFTNEQLAEMVQRRVSTAAALREIAGVGAARVDKYGAQFLSILSAELGTLDPPAEGSDDTQRP
jgi:superfamily II DNA helicase RecQ